MADITNDLTYGEGELEDNREGRRCVSEDKIKMSEMKSVWDGRERDEEDKGEGEVESALDLCVLCQG